MTYEIVGVWILGDILCELYLALDVLFVTASILHICVISLDRYWSVTQPLTYPRKRTTTRISIMIGVAWLVSLLICLPPILGWRPNREPGKCTGFQFLDVNSLLLRFSVFRSWLCYLFCKRVFLYSCHNLGDSVLENLYYYQTPQSTTDKRNTED